MLVHVTSISTSRLGDIEVWITSDGRAYFVHMDARPAASPMDTLGDELTSKERGRTTTAQEVGNDMLDLKHKV